MVICQKLWNNVSYCVGTPVGCRDVEPCHLNSCSHFLDICRCRTSPPHPIKCKITPFFKNFENAPQVNLGIQ